LALADAGRYAECWNQTSSLSKSGIQTSSLFIPGGSEQQWQSSFAAFQADLGRAVARSLKSKQYAEELPYEPEGEYVVLKYETSFERKGNGVETVILMKEEDGAWRVSRYTVVLGWRSIQQSGYKPWSARAPISSAWCLEGGRTRLQVDRDLKDLTCPL